MTSSAFDAWKNRAADMALDIAADRLGLDLKRVTGGRKGPVEMAGPCPAPGCGGTDRFAINTRKNVFNCRRCNASGHGAIDLAIFAKGLRFIAACELLTGEAAPDREAQITDADRLRWEE